MFLLQLLHQLRRRCRRVVVSTNVTQKTNPVINPDIVVVVIVVADVVVVVAPVVVVVVVVEVVVVVVVVVVCVPLSKLFNHISRFDTFLSGFRVNLRSAGVSVCRVVNICSCIKPAVQKMNINALSCDLFLRD